MSNRHNSDYKNPISKNLNHYKLALKEADTQETWFNKSLEPHGAPFNLTFNFDWSIIVTIKWSEIERMQRFYPYGTDKPAVQEIKNSIDRPDAYGRTNLHMAAFGGPPTSANKVKELLASGADPNYKDELGQTPFLLACYGMADVNLINHFLECPKTEVAIKDDRGRNCLHYASNGAHLDKETKSLDVLPLLIKHFKALHHESKNDLHDISTLVNQADKKGLTPLHLVCMPGCSLTTKEGRIAAIKVLINEGALQIKNNQEQTPAEMAKYFELNGYEEIIKTLQEYKPVIDAKDIPHIGIVLTHA